jgi:hypothetical protein
MAPMPQAVYQFKLTLKDVKPPIWRRFQVSNTMSLQKFHQVIQRLMGWANCHLHEFEIEGARYGKPQEDCPGPLDEKGRRIRDFHLRLKDKIRYTYDFGDDWRIDLLLEKVLPRQRESGPVCLGGARSGPPEDSGGPCGYEVKLEALKDPSHPEYEALRMWFPPNFDPEAFSIEAVNRRLRSEFAPRRRKKKDSA